VTTGLDDASTLMNLDSWQLDLRLQVNFWSGSLAACEGWLLVVSFRVECCQRLVDHLLV
jgi:hypothetical protein